MPKLKRPRLWMKMPQRKRRAMSRKPKSSKSKMSKRKTLQIIMAILLMKKLIWLVTLFKKLTTLKSRKPKTLVAMKERKRNKDLDWIKMMVHPKFNPNKRQRLKKMQVILLLIHQGHNSWTKENLK
jgi:hypothetical protein